MLVRARVQSTEKLEAALPDVKLTPIHDAVRAVFVRMREGLIKEGRYPPPNPKLHHAAA